MKRYRLPAARMLPVTLAVIVGMAIGGGAYAAASGGGGTITACVHKHGGGLYRARRCARGDSKLTWGIQGPKGSPGANGVGATKIQATWVAPSSTPQNLAQLGPLELTATCSTNNTYLSTITVSAAGANWTAGGQYMSSGNGAKQVTAFEGEPILVDNFDNLYLEDDADFTIEVGSQVWSVILDVTMTQSESECSAFGTVTPSS